MNDLQRGSAILWVLIAVGLFAAIGFVMSHDSRNNTSMLTSTAADATAYQAQDYTNTVTSAVKRLKLRGCKDDQISMETPNGNNPNPNTPADGHCKVFAVNGGGVQFRGDDAVGSGSKIVFITSTTYNANLGGVAGADAKCMERASAAGLTGTFKAWISDLTVSPNTTFVQSSGPYQLVDGTKIADNYTGLIQNNLYAPIAKTELNTAGGPYVWSATILGDVGGMPGTEATLTCSAWTVGTFQFNKRASLGDASSAHKTVWERGSSYPAAAQQCNALNSLYCFQQ